jgi:16S rRNA (adenine1518-N6/adenine1519-N6)-dimethyltransferase
VNPGTPPPRRQRRFGQHFLEATWAAKVAAAIQPGPQDVFLEIGPGRGALTRPLARLAGHVLAVEIDRDHAAFLAAAEHPRTSVVCADVLTLTPARIRDDLARAEIDPRDHPIRIAGNLPYNVAAPILFAMLAWYRGGLAVADATVMLQREVADRLLAPPGTRTYGVLSVLIRHQARVERVLEIPPGAFRPPPQVRSTLVRLLPHAPDPPVGRLAALEALVNAVFQQRRKTLSNALSRHAGARGLSSGSVLARAGIDPQRRPESLDVPEFVRLADAVDALAPPATTPGPEAVL